MASSSIHRSTHRLLVATVLLAVISVDPAVAEITIQLAPADGPHVEVAGLPPESLAALSRGELDRAGWVQIFALYVVSDGAPSTTPVLGEYNVTADRLQFTPRFPLRPGLSYRAVFDAAAISSVSQRTKSSPGRGEGPGEDSRNSRRVEAEFSIPAPPAQPAIVEAIYPSSNDLPENLLKFYIHFSAPMQRGDSYRHIRLSTDEGEAIDLPFLELAEELWDESGTRLTLLLDPGRVKQELKPNKEVGRALAQGHDYVLSIADDWPDAQRNPLGTEYRKLFSVTPPDIRQPDPRRWQLAVPKAGTQQPLAIVFGEPLDHAMLHRVIRVQNQAGTILNGQVTVGERETEWSFLPAHAWRRGTHQLLIDGTLEDRAGNSIERPFEVYLPDGRPAEVKERIIPFEVQ